MLNSTGVISEDDVYSLLPELNSEIASTQKLDNFSKKEFLSAELCNESFGKSLEFNEEKILFLKALEASQYNRGKAASLLGISRTTLWRKMKDLGI